MAKGGSYEMRDGKRVLVHRTKEPSETKPRVKQQPQSKAEAAITKPVKDSNHG
ncbi:hypothetical protein KF947_21320 [Halomonas sp. FeN2]|uniref:hypothetical protein n=1 Tax=Halomonas sp. FeN2 TaxID=2832500 RepID=UPI001D0BA04C|nr:hypothetical protein [Halomonas sp. FeN2]UBR49818.1 hypothetical protein KF947_21320 [Halomonas sp. FeN2]